MKRDQAALLDPLIRSSYAEAAARGETLTLVRPADLKFRWRKKSDEEVNGERALFQRAAAQGSLLDAPLRAFKPSPYHFRITFRDQAGPHGMSCGDWETTATFDKWSRQYGPLDALARLKKVYEEDYPARGVVLAMGTVAKRPKQWLLLGVIRLDELVQPRLI